MKYYLIIFVLLFSCGNEIIKPSFDDNDVASTNSIKLLNYSSSEFGLNKEYELFFKLPVSFKVFDQSDLDVKFYMKCCKTPVVFKTKLVDDNQVILSVDKFWAAGFYVAEFSSVNDSEVFESLEFYAH